jgi:hypothetical protein
MAPIVFGMEADDHLPEAQAGGYRDIVTRDFINGCRDYYYLVNRNYPERGVLKLTGDRYRLTGDQRTVIYRGISSQNRSVYRNSLLISEVKGEVLVIDGYNVLFSLLNYRLGRVTFISTDNILRDAGSLHGKLRNERAFLGCVDLLMEYLIAKQPGMTIIYLDSPVSHSERHAFLMNEIMQEKSIAGHCSVIRSADWALKHHSEGVIATSDTGIIEKVSRPVVDLPRQIIESNYLPHFIRLRQIIDESGAKQAAFGSKVLKT